MVEHILKTIGTVWDAVERGEKRFEVRRNDRFFQSGDIVVLRRLRDDGFGIDWNAGDLRFRVGWMLQGGQFGLAPGYCVFQLEPEMLLALAEEADHG